MKAILNTLFAFMVLISACSKGGGGGTTPPVTEDNLVVTTTPTNGSVEAPAPGPNFPLTVTVTSKMPAAGVKIEVSAKPEAGGAAFFTSQVNSTTAAATNFTITNTPINTPSLVEITVTSLSTSTNKWTGSYRYSRK